MNIKNIENNIWTDIKIDASNIKIPINFSIPNSYHLIHYAIINSNTKIIKKILSLDPDNILFVNK